MKYISDLHFDKSGLTQEEMHSLILRYALDIPHVDDNSLLIVGDFFQLKSIKKFSVLLYLLSKSFDEIFWIIGNADVNNKFITNKIIDQANIDIKYLGVENVLVLNYAILYNRHFTLITAVNEKTLSNKEININQLRAPVIIATHYPLSSACISLFVQKLYCKYFISGHIHLSLNEFHNGVYLLRNPLLTNRKPS